MSGLLGEAITPCPSRSRSSGFSGSETFDSFLHEDSDYEPTAQIEFTTEIKAPTLKSSRPRRANRVGSGFQIHEDVGEKPTAPVEKRRREPRPCNTSTTRKSSLLSQPAQRFRPKANFSSAPPLTTNQQVETQQKLGPTTKNTKRVSTQNSGLRQSSPQFLANDLRKDVPRDTFYIPADDNAVASAFMDIFSPMKKEPPSQRVSHDSKVNTLEAQTMKRQARKSLAVSARRTPLQPSAKIAQEAAIRVDIAGKNGGKENVPPGSVFNTGKNETFKPEVPTGPKVSVIPASKPIRRSTARPLASSKSTEFPSVTKKVQSPDRSILSEKQNNSERSTYRPARKTSDHDLRASTKMVPSATLNARASALAESLGRSSNLSSKIEVGRSLKLKELNKEYPKLSEDIVKPALYEDDWLSHQETVIAQLCNSLFKYTSGDTTFHDHNAPRLELLEIYHTDHFVQLYQKIQASLLCGTLSMSKETFIRNGRLRRDVGLRRKFLDVWLCSYDHRALTAALETVIGRRVSNDQNLLGNTGNSSPESPGRRNRAITKKLEGFLDTFLLRNEDFDETPHEYSLERKRSTADTLAKAYRRTVLRCIMLVALLDKGKQSPHSSLPSKLFTPTSAFKSSMEVLQAVTRILLPSCGDIAKSLSHLGCRVSYKQHQLQEFNYQMDNLAVDLRDGVRLTRIVEVLFFSPHHFRNDLGDQTITLNTGEALSLMGDQSDVPLSKHLKYPCVSRAAKMFNVQVALSALGSVEGSNTILEDVRAEEIVDGYREKTISLLWALVSKWGLAGLVDWDDLDREIGRLKRKAISQLGSQVENQDWFTGESVNEYDGHTRALHQWASILANLKNVSINNMTTSFSDGKVFESIIDEYQPYILGNTSKSLAAVSLDSRLRLLGCDSQFAHLISPGAASPVLGHDFTLGALAFLCSRLLSASRNSRAATVLQRAWRARENAVNKTRRAMAKHVAEHCAAVVRTRNEILWAKEVITQWWRQTQARRQKDRITRAQSLPKQNRISVGWRV